jgi:predicted nucleic acid-binding protein
VAPVARYLVDKSALARLQRPSVAARLEPLLEAGVVATCAVVELEVGFSARSARDYAETMRDRAVGYLMLPMDDWVWQRALDVQARLAAEGQMRSVPIPDLLIAATAERHRVTVLHYDEDYERIAAITGQPTEWVVARGSVS